MNVYSERYTARYHEMGQDRRLRVQCLCNYLEEAASCHADALGLGLSTLAEDGLAWVLAKMRLRMEHRPGPGEGFRVDTWPVAIERLQFRRDFEVFDDHGQVIARAVTQWVVMNVASRRLERFPLRITAHRPESPRLALENGDIRIPALGDNAVTGPSFPVRLADIDQNTHVNNGRYIDFALEAAHDSGMANGDLKEMDIIFRAEGRRGDSIGSRSEMESHAAQSMLHSLFREGDGQELARARTIWS